MKVKTGGGGIDKDGNAYTLPEQEINFPDDHFVKIVEAMKRAPSPGTLVVGPTMWKMFTSAMTAHK